MMAEDLMPGTSSARWLSLSVLLSRTPGTGTTQAGNTTAAATTGPARGPRPTSSTPMRRRRRDQAASSRLRLGRGCATAAMSAVFLFPDPGGFAAHLAEVIELRATNSSFADDFDRREGRAVHREDALDADAGRHFPDPEGLV